MIEVEIAQAAIDLAQNLDARDISVVAEAGSELADLVALSSLSTVHPVNIGMTPEELHNLYNPTAEDIARQAAFCYTSPDGQKQGNLHDGKLEETVTALADAVSAHLNHAKNVVAPAVKAFHDRVEQSVAASAKDNTFSPAIVKNDIPAPLQAASLMSVVMDYHGFRYETINSPLVAGERENITELLLTGNAVVDGDIKQWLIEGGQDSVNEVWRRVFNGNEFNAVIEDAEFGTSNALAIYLLARRLVDEPLDGLAMTLGQWKTTMNQLLAQSAKRLADAITERESRIKAGLWLIKRDQTKIVVLKPVYDQFIAEGGNDAVIYGAVLMDYPPTNVDTLRLKTADCLEKWESVNRIQTQTANNNRYRTLKTALELRVRELVTENCADYFEPLTAVGQHVTNCGDASVQAALREAIEYIDELSPSDLTDLWAVSLNVIAKHVFGYSCAFEILNGINEISKVNPELSAQQAADLSTVQYMTDYICSKLKIVTI